MSGAITLCVASVGEGTVWFMLDAVVKATVLTAAAYLATVLNRHGSCPFRWGPLPGLLHRWQWRGYGGEIGK